MKLIVLLYQKSHSSFKVALQRLFLKGIALVMESFTSAYAQCDFNPAMFQVDLQRNKRKPFRLRLKAQFANFLGVNQELAHALRFMIESVAELVGRDIGPHKPELVLKNSPVRPRERNLAVTHRFNLGSRQDNTALDGIEYGIIMTSLAVLAKNGIKLTVSHLYQSAKSELTLTCFWFHLAFASSALA